MKTLFLLLAASILSSTFAFVPATHNIVGHWFTTNPDGSKNYVDLKSDGTFTSYYKEKLMHYGNYTFNDPVVSIADTEDDACGGGYWGKYNANFVGEDSVTLVLVEDSCTGRSQAVNGMGLRR